MNEIICGDALAVLKTLPSKSVQCCVTSPPYFALRDYGVEGQIGLEESPAEYVANLVQVFRAVYRVLRDDGTCWINIGDSYANDRSYGGHSSGKHRKALHEVERPRRYTGLPAKNLIGIPWRLAFALQDDGWILRSDIIWNKPTAMPESVTNRPTRSHEYIFLFVKSERYYYDAAAIAEPSVSGHSSGNGFKRDARLSYIGADGTARGSDQEWIATSKRNKRDVWTVASQPFPDAHFATFPPKLIEPCILAGSTNRACEHCGTPWQRVTVPTGHVNQREEAHVPGNTATKTDSTGWQPVRVATDKLEPGCTCLDNAGSTKSVVLDPFSGAGTTAFVAARLGRQYIGVELNPEYVEMSRKRLVQLQAGLWGFSEVAS